MNGVLKLASTFPRLTLGAITGARRISTSGYPLHFQVTSALLGEPLKKKKKLDPAIIRQREERKKKKIEKQIRRLEKYSKQLKPIAELEIPVKLIEEKGLRSRLTPSLSTEQVERRAVLLKKWTQYKRDSWIKDIQTIDSVLASQRRALDELKMESEPLYEEAIQIDISFGPYEAKGPVHTPLIANYNPPDGEYVDITRKFEGED